MAEEITGVSAIVAAGLVGIISIANGAGRFLWAWLSDVIGRKWVFLTMFLIQAVVFFLLPRATTFGLFTALAFIVLLCYGAASAPCRRSPPTTSGPRTSARCTG